MISAVSQSVHPEVLKPSKAKEVKQGAIAWAFGEGGCKASLANGFAAHSVRADLTHQIVTATNELAERQMEHMHEDRANDTRATEERKQAALKRRSVGKQSQKIHKLETPRYISETVPAEDNHVAYTMSKPDKCDPNMWKEYVHIVAAAA